MSPLVAGAAPAGVSLQPARLQGNGTIDDGAAERKRPDDAIIDSALRSTLRRSGPC
jgi:hypothetical protein